MLLCRTTGFRCSIWNINHRYNSTICPLNELKKPEDLYSLTPNDVLSHPGL